MARSSTAAQAPLKMHDGQRYLTAVISLAFIVQAACGARSEWEASSIDEGQRRWVSVYRDANYRIFVDTAHMRIDRPFDKSYLIWYRTEHRTPHIRLGRKWNREVSRAIVSCNRHQFKVISADLSLGDAKPISQQRATPMEVDDQPWHEVPPGTPDAASLRATCWLAENRYQPRVTTAGTTR